MTAHRARAALLIAVGVLVPSTAAAQAELALDGGVPEPILDAAAAAPEPIPEPAPTDEVEPAPTDEVAVDASDDDLVALGLDNADSTDRLNLYGFMDVSYTAMFAPPGSLWGLIRPTENMFSVGNLNLYLTRALSDRWRSFLEVRFTYAPGGATDSNGNFVNTQAPDPANAYRNMTWGGVAVERAYLEYDVSPALTVQVGSFLTPYGIWNVDHGAPAIIPASPPWIIGEKLFPEQQTGVHLYGARPMGEYTVDYHATVSNGRGPLQAFRDLDENKALGLHLQVTAPWFGATKLGVSGYRGRSTDRPANKLTVDEHGDLQTVVPAGVSFDEWSLGAHLLVERGALRVQAEVLANHRAYRDGARGFRDGAFLADNRFVGGYFLAGYRLDRWWQAMPYVELEANDLRDSPRIGAAKAFIQAVGVNLRPVPSVVLKIQFAAVEAVDSETRLGVMKLFSTQAAWAF